MTKVIIIDATIRIKKNVEDDVDVSKINADIKKYIAENKFMVKKVRFRFENVN